jgi:asparagine synthase (glutamine-hydrolysing)
MKPKSENLVMLLKIKNGLIYLAHGFLPRLLEEIRHKHPSSRINFFTGHGGDISFTNLSTDVEDVNDCIRAILHIEGKFTLNEIMALTNIKKSELRDEIIKILSSYPEEKPAQKLAHYIFFEINYKFSFEVEDVNRFYFWSVSPFYSVPFFKYIFNCSDQAKEKLALYREFLLSISPEPATISNSDWGCSIVSRRFKIFQHILYLSNKYYMVWKFIKKVYDKRAYSYKSDSPIIRCIMEQVNNCNYISNYLSPTAIKKILSISTDYKHEGIDNLLTITSLIENTLCNKSALNKYF